jgi:hypothetical protein
MVAMTSFVLPARARRPLALLVGFVGVLAVGCSHSIKEPSVPQPPSDPLEGFVPTVPQSVFPIGQVWQDNSGPTVATPVDSALLVVSNSYDTASFGQLRGHAVDLKARLLAILHLAVGHNKTVQDSLQMNHVEIVTVRNLLDLSPTVNQQLIVAAVRVSDLTYTFSAGDTTGARASVDSLAKSKGDVAIAVGENGRKSVHLQGAHLFIGMRVIELRSIEKAETTVVVQNQRHVELGRNMAVEVGVPGPATPAACSPAAVHDTSQCVARLWVMDEANVGECANTWGIVRGEDKAWYESTGLVTTKAGSFDETLRLLPVVTTGLFISNDLLTDGVTFEVKDGSVRASGPFHLKTRLLHFNAVPRAHAAGWTN